VFLVFLVVFLELSAMNEIRFEQGDGWQALSSDRLRLEFRWQRDRWAHRVLFAGDSQWLPLLGSVETFADSDLSDPVEQGAPFQTPALQQLHVDELECGLCALGVGQVGVHHFATTFTFDATRNSLCVDVADRVRRVDASDRVVSAYELRVDPSVVPDRDFEPSSVTERAIAWRMRDPQTSSFCVRASAVPDHPAAAVCFERRKAKAPRVWVAPPSVANDATTRRWVYRVELADPK